MLAISRKSDQSVIITMPDGATMNILVKKVPNTASFRLVFDLPSKDYIVDRAELYEKHKAIREAKKQEILQ